ncbi:MAG: histidine phosphatase family protein [bacterium]|nr:histidine phosphatase family protein [bacterium]
MKTIYFVRHGESEGNAGLVFQGPSSSLTEKGKEQAAFLAKRFTKLSVDVIIASTMKRAEETAVIINDVINKPIEFSGLFVERRRPSWHVGRAKDDPEVLEADKRIQENFGVEEFRLSDEENFEDLKERAEKSLKYLAHRKEDKILVVTHGLFLRIVMASIIFEKNLTGREAGEFIRAFHMKNTGITVVINDPEATKTWWIRTWNDHAHLG